MAFAAARMIKEKAKRPSIDFQLNPAQHTGDGPPYPLPRSSSGRALLKGALARGHVKRTRCKGKNGKKGKGEVLDLIVTIDLEEWQLTPEQVAEFKEVFMLFDKDEDGVITFPEVIMVMKSLGQRPSDEELLEMVREVSEDKMYDTIEFNEYLQMMSKQQKKGLTQDILKDAFRIFDKDDDGLISVEELRKIMKNMGDKMTDQELDEMLDAADTKHDGMVNYTEFVMLLSKDSKKSGKGKGKKRTKKISQNSQSNKKEMTKSASNANMNNLKPIQESGTNGFNGSKSNENILNNNATKHTPNNIVKQKKPTTPTPTVTSTKADTKSRR